MTAGLVGEWDSAAALVAAVRRLRRSGYTQLDAHTPFAVPGLEEALDLRRSLVGWPIFAAGLGGAAGAYFIQFYCNAWSYPINVGGRPAHAPPAFVPITFETMVLLASMCALGLFFLLARLPWLTHPVFEVEGFERATIDRFFLAVAMRDPAFEADRTARDLLDAGALRVSRFGEAAR